MKTRAVLGFVLAAQLAACGVVALAGSPAAQQMCEAVAKNVSEDGTSRARVVAAYATDVAGLRRTSLRANSRDPTLADELDRWGVADESFAAVLCYVDVGLVDAPAAGSNERWVIGQVRDPRGTSATYEVISIAPPAEVPITAP